MKIPPELIQKFFTKRPDADTEVFLDYFDESEKLQILEVGSHDAPIANLLADMGHRVTGFDLRSYDPEFPPCNYQYRREDFCNPDRTWLENHIERYDVAVAVSCIEHFGMNTYGESPSFGFYYDVMAMRMIWHLLKENGTCYVSVPYAGKHSDCFPNWRTYNLDSFMMRIVQDFQLDYLLAFVADSVEIKGVIKHRGESVTLEEINSYDDWLIPHISAFAKLKKVPVNRLALDGR